jgi:hypothetical protein
MEHVLLHTKACLMIVKTSAVFQRKVYLILLFQTFTQQWISFGKDVSFKVFCETKPYSRHAECHGSCWKLRHCTVKHFDIMLFIAKECSNTRRDYEMSLP